MHILYPLALKLQLASALIGILSKLESGLLLQLEHPTATQEANILISFL